MANIFEFVAESRSDSGKGGAKIVRRRGMVPAVIYGSKGETKMLSLGHKEVLKHLEHEAVYSHVLDVKIDGKTERAILKDIQRHPSKQQILHMDFLRISDTDKIRVHAPVHCIGEDNSVGVKKGGVVMHNLVDIEISCLPSVLPEYIEIDMSNIDIGDAIHLSDISLPAGVEIVALMQGEEHNTPVVSILASKGGDDDDAAVEEEIESEPSEEE